MPCLLKFLSYEKDFARAASEILEECADCEGMEEICLVQTEQDADSVTVVAIHDNTGFWNVKDGHMSISHFIKESSGVGISEQAGAGKVITVPVYLNGKAAMYVCAHISGHEDGIVRLLTQAALVIQSMASHRIFADSLEDSYKLLGNVLDCVPAGVAVLDCGNRNVLLMNRTLEKSETMQSVIGKALAANNITQDTSIKDMPEEKSGRWFDLDFIYIRWIQGEQVLMCSVLDVTERVKDRERVEYQANNDYLTGLYNRLKFERDIKAELDESDSGAKGMLIYLDLDDFKQINDTFGHQYGDVLLQNIAGALMQIEPIADSCYRLGGDEFVIIIKSEYYHMAGEITRQIQEIFTREWDLMGVGYCCTMSMGAAVYPDDGAYVKEIMQNADYAMYKAKKSGKNRFFMYSDCIDESTHGRTYMIQELAEAVEADYRGFNVEYDVVPGVKSGLEYTSPAVKFTDASGCVIDDTTISELAEYRGLDAAINEYVMEQTFKIAADGKYKGTKYLITLTGSQISSDKFIGMLDARTAEYGISPSEIVLCLSCRHGFRDENKVTSATLKLKESGYTVAISDFEEGSMALGDINKYNAGLVIVRRTNQCGGRLFDGVVKALKAFTAACDFDLCIMQ